MKDVLTIIFISLTVFSCSNQDKKTSSFKTIDISISNGWTKTVCVNIDSEKTIHCYVDELNNPKEG